MANKIIERKTLLTVFGVVMGILLLLWIGLLEDRGVYFPGWDFAMMYNYMESWLSVIGYLPLAYLMFKPFVWLTELSSMELSCAVYLLISIPFWYFFLYKLGKSKKSTFIVLGALFFSTECIFALHSGNNIIQAAGLLAAFLFLYDSPRKVYRGLALVCLSVAAVMKIYPVLFGFLLLFDKRYKSIAICAVLGLALTFLPFLALNGGFFENIERLFSTMSAVQKRHLGGHFGFLSFPAWVVYKMEEGVLNPWEFHNTLFVILKYMQLLLAIVSIALCFFTKNNWLKVAILSIIVIVLSGGGISYHYVGVLFFPTIVLFFNKQTYTQKDILYVLLFCLFLSPFSGVSIAPAVITLANISLLLLWGLLLIDILKEVKSQ